MECAVSTLLMWLTPFPHSHICSDCYLLSDAYLIYFDISHPLVLLFTVMFIVSHTSLAWQFYEGNDLCLFCVLVYTQNLKSYLTLSRGSIVASQVFNFCELKWTGMGKFNSDDHYIYYCQQESLRRNGVAIMVNKRVWNAVLGCSLKTEGMISVCLQVKPCNITGIQVYTPTSNTEKTELNSFMNTYKTF